MVMKHFEYFYMQMIVIFTERFYMQMIVIFTENEELNFF